MTQAAMNKADMTPERWKRLETLYAAAVELPKEERAQFIADQCRNQPEDQRELEKLLEAHEQQTDSLDQPLVNLRDICPDKGKTLADGDTLLGRFRIVRFLESGGMGEVYEAEDSLLRGVHVALKIIRPRIASDPAIQKNFEREVLLAREVVHPNLCPIYDIFRCEEPPPGFLFLTMKFLPGGTLAERLRQSASLSSEEGMAVLRQSALGLAAIHAAGIVHRDIKPNNIMIDGRGAALRLWITDFGLARAYQTETTVSGKITVAGTPGYIAPELFLGHPPSQASDLFALGVVLHEVFAGQKPTPVPSTRSYAVSPKLATPRVPALCVHLITECLQDNTKRRCAAFAETLEVLDSKVDRSQYTGRTRQFWTRRRFAGAAAASVCAAAGGAWWKWDDLENALHPLPAKRFVALLNWPKSSDAQVTPMLTGALSAIKSELSRLESVDRDLFVISPEDVGADLAETNRLKDICDCLGANLVLAASGLPGSTQFEVLLRLLDPVSGHSLRERTVEAPISAITTLPQKAVEAAAALLNLRRYLYRGDDLAGPGTHSSAAFAAYQSAEALTDQPNDAGLDAAIEKYKQAVEIDPRYAMAYAKLALAYLRLSSIRHDSSILDMARRNSQASLALNPNLVDGHLSMAAVLKDRGDDQGALKEYAKALALDPSDPRTLVWEAQLYTKLNRWADAERTLHRALEQRPNYWLAYNALGIVLNDQGRYPEALDAFRAASVAAPGGSLAYSNVGAIYFQMGNLTEAASYLKKSLSLKPTAAAAANLSGALRAQGKAEEALPYALKAVELDRDDDSNWLELGDCYSSLPGRQSSAKDAYKKAESAVELHLRTDSTDGSSWMQLALYRVKSGNSQDAFTLIMKAETLGAGDIDSQLSKARVQELLGRRDEAIATIKACFLKGATDVQVSLAPDLESLRRDTRYLEILRLNSGNKAV